MRASPLPRDVGGRVALACGAFTAGIGALILAGWAVGLDSLAAMGAGYPAAPNTGLLLTLLGSAVAARQVLPASRAVGRAAAGAAVISASVGGLTLLGFLIPLRIDHILFRTTRTFESVPMGQMSALTASCLVLVGASMLVRGRHARTWTATLGALIGLAGAVALLGYAFGRPLLHGEARIPVALPTSMALLTLGAGLAASAGPGALPMNLEIGSAVLAIFGIDCLTPLGYAVWLLYVAPLLRAVWVTRRRDVVPLAGICTVLVSAGFFLSPHGIDSKVAIFDRGLGVAVLWLTAVLSSRRAHAEEALRERERMLSESQRIAHVGSWVLGLDGRVAWSDETYRIYGLSPGTSPPSGESFPSLIHPEDRPAMQAWIAACQAGEKPGELQFRVIWPDGAVHTLSGIGERMNDAEGRPAHMSGTVQDITERSRAEEELREAGERLRLVIEGTKTGLWVWDLRTNSVRYSREWKRLLGYEEEEVGDDLGEWRRLTHPDDVEPTLDRVGAFLAGPQTAFESEFRMRHKGGEYRWVLSRATKVLGDDGRAARLLGLHIDITDRKRAEARIRQLNRLLRTTTEIDRLIVRTEERGRLLSEACRILVEYGSFRMAWIGVRDAASGLVRPEARAGAGLDYLEGAEIRFDDTPEGRGPTGTAIRTGRSVVVSDLGTDASVAPWRERQLARGFRSSGAFPIRVRGNVTAALAVYSAEPGAIGAEETALLDDLVGDIGYALEAIEDRTERREAEERYRGIFEGAVEGIVRTTSAGRFVTVNPSFARMLGYDSPEALVSAINDTRVQVWLRPEQRDEFRRRMADQGAVTGLETELRRKDGTVLWAAMNATAVRDSTGGVAFYDGTVEDITERKRAERALLERHAELVNLYSTTPVGLALIDRDMRFVRVNERLAAINGKSVEEHIGRSIGEVLPDLAPMLTGIYRGIKETGEPVLDVEIHGTTPAEPGIARDWLASYSPVWGADGSVSGISIAVLEVTGLKKAEAALRESERRYRTLVSQSPVGIFETETRGRCIFVNRRLTEILGMSPEEAIGYGWVKAIDAEDRAGVLAAWERATESGEPFDLEYRFRTPRGDVTWVRGLTSSVRDSRGEIVGYLGTVIDISARKWAEEELRRAQTMAALGAVVAGVAHEVRNPLFAMSSTLDAFEERLGGAPAPHLAILRREMDRLGRLASDLLDYGRETRLELRSVSLGEVLSAAALESERSTGGSGGRVEVAVPGELPALRADRDRLQQVFLNVFDNAIHHSPSEGVVHAAARLVPGEKGDLLECTVADGGPGFTPEGLERAFEPFFSRRRGGTGLGLSIARRLVEAHGGTITAGNRPEGGAVVTVRLPVAGPRGTL